MPKQEECVTKLLGFDYTIEYCASSSNQMADVLIIRVKNNISTM